MFGSKVFGSKRRYGYSSYYRPYKRSRWGSTYSKSVGSARAAKIGNKLSYYNAQVSGYVTFNFATGSFTSDVHTFQPFTNRCVVSGSGSTMTYAYDEQATRHGGATFDKGFRLMCAMNDQVRLLRMTVRLQPATAIPSNAAIRVYSVVDRNLTHAEFINQYTDSTAMDDAVSAKDIMENQGALVQTFNSNRVAPLSRMCRPTDIKENTSWIDSSISYFTTVGGSPLYDMSVSGWEKDQTDFCPAFHYACQSSIAAASDSTFTFGYTVEYVFAFRNPKSGLDFFIRNEAVGYVNPAAKAKAVVPAAAVVDVFDGGSKDDVKEEVEDDDHDPGTS